MQKKSAVLVMAVALALGTSGSVRADDDDDRDCSNRTLRGDYGFHIEGQIFGGPAPITVRGVALTHFNGRGGLTQVDFVTFNGVPAGSDWRPATGTYEVNADCTGSGEIVPVTGPPIGLRFVVVDRGREIRTVVSSGNATISTGIRVR